MFKNIIVTYIAATNAQSAQTRKGTLTFSDNPSTKVQKIG